MRLRLKYRVYTGKPQYGFPAIIRTNNSHGPIKSKRPSLVPCKRNPAAKVFVPSPQKVSPVKVLVVDGLTGKRRFENG